MWKHASITNMLFLHIYKKHLNKIIPEFMMSAGLLHNIGAVFMVKHFTGDYLRLLESIEQLDCDLPYLEDQAFNMNHQQIGGYLMHWWDLPYPIKEAARYHHNPLDLNIVNKELIAVIHLAQHYAWNIMNSFDKTLFYCEVFNILGLNQKEFEDELKVIEWCK